MAESIRDLVVRLTLNTDNFTKNIAAVNRQMKEAESAFKLSANGISDYEKTASGRKSYIEMLTRQQSLQTVAIDNYKKKLAEETATLQENQAQKAKLTEKIAAATAARDKEVTALEKAKKKLEEVRQTADTSTPDGEKMVAEATEAVEKQAAVVASADKELSKLNGQYKACDRSAVNAANRITTLNTNLNNAQSKLKSLTRELLTAQSGLTAFANSTERIGNAFVSVGTMATNIGKQLGTLGRSMSMYITTPIVAAGKQSVQASIDFERSFANVRKVTTATEEEFNSLADSVKEMSITVGSSTDSISAVMTTASQLGIATKDLSEFTRLMIDLGNTTTTTAETAAESLAKFVNVTGMQATEYSNLANAITYTGNNFATTQDDIIAMALQLAGAGKQVGMSEADIIGVATALSSVGIEAQRGGSSFSKALVKMQLAVANGGQDLTDFAQIAGVTEEQFKTMFNNSPVDAFAAFINGLAQMDEEGESAIAVLTDMGISEIRLRDTILRTTNAHEMFGNAVKASNQAWKDNNALTEATEEVYNTMAVKIENLKNNFTLLAQTIGDDLKGDVSNLADWLKEIVDKFKGLDTATRKSIIKFAAIAAAIGPIALIGSKIFKVIGSVTTGIGKTFLALSKGARTLATFSANVQMLGGGINSVLVTASYGKGAFASFANAALQAGGGFGGLMKAVAASPITWFALAAAVVYASYKLFDWASGAKEAREQLEQLKKTADEWEQNNVQTSFEGSKGVDAFGISTDSFDVTKNSNFDSWFTELKTVWTDGEKETDEILAHFVDGFVEKSDTIREKMQELRDDDTGFTNPEYTKQVEADMEQLDSIDAELEALLKKRQNGLLTDEEFERIQQLNAAREALVIKYKLEPEGNPEQAYETIRNGVDSALNRGASKETVFTDSYTAATQGLTASIDALNTEFDTEYSKIMQTTEEGSEERKQQLEALQEWYNTNKQGLVQNYNDTMSYITEKTGMFEEGGGYSSTIEQITELQEALKSGDKSKINEILAGLDEQTVVELASSLSTMDAAAQTAGTTLDEVSPSAAAANTALQSLLQTVTDPQYLGIKFGDDIAQQIQTMFGTGLQGEVYEINATLGTDTLNASYDAWAKGNHEPIGGTVTIEGTPEEFTGAKVSVSTIYSDESTVYDIGAYDGLKITGLTDNGEAVNIDVAALNAGETLKITGLTDDGKEIGVNVEALNDGKMTITDINSGDAVTVNVREINDLDGFIKTILIGEGCVIPSVDVEGHIVVNTPPTFGEGFTLSGLPQDVFDEAGGHLSEEVFANTSMFAQIKKISDMIHDTSFFGSLFGGSRGAGNGILQMATRGGSNPKAFEDMASYLVNGLQLISNGEMDEDKLQEYLQFYSQIIDILNDPSANKEGDTGVSFSTLFANAFSEKSGYTVAADEIVTNLGAALLTASSSTNFDESGQYGAQGYLNGFTQEDPATTTQQFIDGVINGVNTAQDAHSPAVRFNEPGMYGAMGYLEGFNSVDPSVDMQTFINKVIAALGGTPPSTVETPTNVEPTVETVDEQGITDSIPDEVNTGKTVTATVTTTVTSTTPQTVSAGTVDTSGLDASAGVKAAGAKTIAAMRTAFSASAFTTVGTQAMAGLKNGIASGTAGVVTQIRTAANAAVAAAKQALQIHSPSRVFRDEVGVMVMKGLGKGIEQETHAQQKVIRNAMGYLSDAAKQTSIIAGGNNNSRTYTDNSAVNINGNFYVRSDNDIRQLSHEIASLTHSQQLGKGVRFG